MKRGREFSLTFFRADRVSDVLDISTNAVVHIAARRRRSECNMGGLGRVTMLRWQRAGVSRSRFRAFQPATTCLNPARGPQIRKSPSSWVCPNILSLSFIKQRSYLISCWAGRLLPVASNDQGIEETLERRISCSVLHHGSGEIGETSAESIARVDGRLSSGHGGGQWINHR